MEKFLNELPQEFAAAKTVEFIATPGFCYHQIDAGKSTAGTLYDKFIFVASLFMTAYALMGLILAIINGFVFIWTIKP